MSHYDLAPLLVCFCHGWIMGGGDDDSSGQGCFHSKSDAATKISVFCPIFNGIHPVTIVALELSATRQLFWLPQPMSRRRCQSRVCDLTPATHSEPQDRTLLLTPCYVNHYRPGLLYSLHRIWCECSLWAKVSHLVLTVSGDQKEVLVHANLF